MQRLEQFTVAYDWSTPTRRLQKALTSSWDQTVLLFFVPVCYVAYFGGSAKICRAALGSALLTFTIALLGYVITANTAFLFYGSVLGFAMLIIALRLVCPRNSEVHTQAIKQALVLLVGNVLLMNVIPETGVRRSWRDSFVLSLALADTPPYVAYTGPGSLPANVRAAEPLQRDRQVLHGLCGVLPHCGGPQQRWCRGIS
jgi:hypothetical protein